MFVKNDTRGPNCPAFPCTICTFCLKTLDIHLVRIAFLTTCVIAGLLLGLWWTGNITFAFPASRQPVTSVPGLQETPAQSAPSGVAENTEPAATEPVYDALPVPSNSTAGPKLSYHDGIMRVAPAVVSVYASNPTTHADNPITSQGSGVVVDEDGIVLTNLHLIDNFEQISIVLSDGRSYSATLIGSDIETDLAVVRIEADMLPYVKLDEARPLNVGDIVLAIGNPFGVGQTVTQGIVSATRRRIANGSVWQNFIQIDAAINPGNSGGALINPLGQLVGVNTAVFRGDSGAVGIGFSIPAELLAQVVPQIIEYGSVSRGWLGLGAEDINMFPSLTSMTNQGVVITDVQKDGPAYKIGVQPMDIVVQLGEQPINNATQFLLAVSALPPGATVKLALLRSPDPQTLKRTGGTEPLQPIVYKVRLGTRPIINDQQPR